MLLHNYVEKLMSEIHQIRRANIKLLRDIAEADFKEQHPDSTYKDYMFAEYIGLSRSYYSQIKNPDMRPNISERTARAIEIEVELPTGWLDKDHETDNYEDVFLDGFLIKKLMLLFKDFLLLDNINFDADTNDEKLAKAIENIIIKTSKYQDLSLDDIVALYVRQK